MTGALPNEYCMTPPDNSAAPLAVRFRHQLMVATLSLLFVVLVIHLLEKFALILQQLLIAVLISYMLLPVHNWLVKRGIRSQFAFVLILTVLLLLFVGVGYAVYASVTAITPDRLVEYRGRFESWGNWAIGLMGKSGGQFLRDRFRVMVSESNVSAHDVLDGVKGVAGSFVGILTFALVVFVYLVFLSAETLSLPRRLGMAFGEQKSTQLLSVVRSINAAIAKYIAVKTWISFVTAFLSLLVLAGFGIEFAVLWALLIFFLNFIPYLGSVFSFAPPIALAFLQFDQPWRGLGVTILLIAVQLFTGQFLEPRMAGRKLNLSPLLIILALAFWGYLWGVVGMILAVPLTVVCKIILDNMPATKPVGSLMSNV